MKDKVDLYLKAIGRGVAGTEEVEMWPLIPSQIAPYFEAEQAVEIYNLIKMFKRYMSKKEIAMLFRYPSVIRNFVRNAGIIGLKVANKVGLAEFSKREKVNYLNYLIGLISQLVINDPLCLDDKNIILSSGELNGDLKKDFQETNQASRWVINCFYVCLFNWMWSTHYNMFVQTGLEAHGPYDVSAKFGKNSKLLVRDFHGINTSLVWKCAKELPFKKVKLYQIYRGADMRINFETQIMTETGLGPYLTHFLVEVDNKQVSSLKEIKKLDDKVSRLTQEQTKYVNDLNDFEKVKKGAQTSFFSLKNIYERNGEPWWKGEILDRNFKLFGDQFLKGLSGAPILDRRYFETISDPRNDLLGADIIKMIK